MILKSSFRISRADPNSYLEKLSTISGGIVVTPDSVDKEFPVFLKDNIKDIYECRRFRVNDS